MTTSDLEIVLARFTFLRDDFRSLLRLLACLIPFVSRLLMGTLRLTFIAIGTLEGVQDKHYIINHCTSPVYQRIKEKTLVSKGLLPINKF